MYFVRCGKITGSGYELTYKSGGDRVMEG